MPLIEKTERPSLFRRDNFGYSVPILPAESVTTPRTVSFHLQTVLTNLLLALFSTAVLGLSTTVLTVIRGSASARRFLRRLPLSLAAFLAFLGLRAFLSPTAFAQTGSGSGADPFSFVALYGMLFFVVAGATNFVCNNLVAAEGAVVERFFLPTRDAQSKERAPWKRSVILIFLFFLLYAAIGAHINTSFSLLPLAQPGIALVALATIVIAAYAKDGMRFALAAHQHRGRWLEANLVGLLLAMLSIWITRALQLSPGYLFGIPAGVFIVVGLHREREGLFEWAGLLTMLVVALCVWLLLPFAAGMQVVEDFMRLLIVILLEACFFESLPLPYLAGETLYRWNRWAWALQCMLVTFLVLHLLWNPVSTLGTLAHSPPTMTYVALLGLYAVAVLLLVGYYRIWRRNG